MAYEGIKVLGIAGSLRKGSYNRMLLLNALQRLPAGVEWKVADIDGIPLLNEDEMSNVPPEVLELRRNIEEADLVVISTPEYNHSTSGALKNAIDWLSRPRKGNPFEWKPVVLMSASTGMLGGIRAQEHLRQILASLGALVVTYPEVVVGSADSKFDEDGRLKDPVALRFIDELLGNGLRLAKALKVGLELMDGCEQRVG